MGLCVGLAVVMQIITLHAPPIKLNLAAVRPAVAAECSDLPVAKSSRIPDRSSSWRAVPNVKICPQSDVSHSRALKATKFWRRLGYDFGDIFVAPRHDMGCVNGEPNLNEILIDLPGQGFEFGDHLGTTKTWYDSNTKEIFRAKIEIVHGWGAAERVLEHEIGHALGWRDTNTHGHLMNRSWTAGGWNTRGLSIK